MDRDAKLAELLVNYSCAMKPKEKVLIESSISALNLVKEIVKEVFKIGGYPFVKLSTSELSKEVFKNLDEDYVDLSCKYMKPVMEDMDAYIGISCPDNIYNFSNIPQEKLTIQNIKYSKPIHHDIRVLKTKWVILKYPNSSFAQLSNMPDDDFKDFYYKVCTLDYRKMRESMKELKKLLDKSDKITIISPNTHLEFSIKGISSIICAGEMNIPDGEIYTAPVKNSVNGQIQFNMPTMYDGKRFDKITIVFENGKIIKATSENDTNSLNRILDTDSGSRYLGEFAFGLNPYINEPMLDILFDEKINGSIHLAVGASYKDAYNGNDSSIHWDLVLGQRSCHGGGEIWIDNVLIRKDGLFIPENLKILNPKNLE